METELQKSHQGGGLKRLRWSDKELEKKKPFADFWMGTHGSGPSFVVESGVENGDSIGSRSLSLKEWIT
ncbi:unnamed protein product [Dovyalis caffra]|uniref:Phosphomannose isomerase type I catalytic domain-containing protein n=1 Tax=Dovyalis caffra TaxID=77055 RepID=A0AAV1R3P2_9ROSI|nr:unnamed protein product [Dovyalis caffra]